MHLAGNARAFLLANVLQIDGQRAQLLVRLAQLLLCPPPLRALPGFPQGPVH